MKRFNLQDSDSKYAAQGNFASRCYAQVLDGEDRHDDDDGVASNVESSIGIPESGQVDARSAATVDALVESKPYR